MGKQSRLKRERAYRGMINSIWRNAETGAIASMHVPRIFRSELPASLWDERARVVEAVLVRVPKSAGEFIHMLRIEGRRREVEKLIEEGL